MEKVYKLTESELHQLVTESVKKLNDRLDVIEDSILSMQHEQDDELITPDTPDISEYQ